MTLNGAIMQLVEMRESSMVPVVLKPYFDKVIETISECVEPSEMPQWIPCSERLPEKDTCFYLVTIANHGLNFTTTLPNDVDVVRWDYDRRKGHNSWHWCTERTVIAWMPLPAPYQAERREV